MGNCLHPARRKDEQTHTNGGTQSNAEHSGGSRDNKPLNSFLRAENGNGAPSAPPARTMSRASALSYKSARSAFDDEVSSTGDFRSVDGDAQSLDLDRWGSHGSHGGESDRPMSGGSRMSGGSHPSGGSPTGGSPGSCTPPESPPGGSGVHPTTLRKAWDTAGAKSRRRSHTKRPSLAGSLTSTLSRRLSSATPAAAAEMQLHDHEREESPAHVDMTAYDQATVLAHNAIFGHDAPSLLELPLLPAAPWNRQPGYLGHLTPGQADKLEALRAAFPTSARYHTDHDLLRFLRARNFDLAATRAMYLKYCIVYRERLMVSPAPLVRPTFGDCWQLCHVDLFPRRPEAATKEFQDALTCFLHVMVYSVDRQGRPVVYMRVADIVKHGMMDHVSLASRIALQSAANEVNRLLCMMASARAGHQIEEITQIMDVGGVSVFQMLKHIRSTETQKEFAHNSDFMPESLGKIIVLNAPFGMGQVWNLAKVFIPPSTRDKISICSSDPKSELLKHIDADNLPSCYGGNARFEWSKHNKPKSVYS